MFTIWFRVFVLEDVVLMISLRSFVLFGGVFVGYYAINKVGAFSRGVHYVLCAKYALVRLNMISRSRQGLAAPTPYSQLQVPHVWKQRHRHGRLLTSRRL